MDQVDEPKGPSISPTPTTSKPGLVLYSFIEAFQEVCNGARITKAEWDNENIYGVMKFDDAYQSKILMLHKDDGKFYHWILSEADMVGEDWIILSHEN